MQELQVLKSAEVHSSAFFPALCCLKKCVESRTQTLHLRSRYSRVSSCSLDRELLGEIYAQILEDRRAGLCSFAVSGASAAEIVSRLSE